MHTCLICGWRVVLATEIHDNLAWDVSMGVASCLGTRLAWVVILGLLDCLFSSLIVMQCMAIILIYQVSWRLNLGPTLADI